METEHSGEDEEIEIRFKCNPGLLRSIERIKALSGVTNLAEAISDSVLVTEMAYDLTMKGFDLRAVSKRLNGVVYSLRLRGMPGYENP